MTASNTFGRATVWALTNKSGGGVVAGDVVVIDTANNDSFTTTTSASSTAIIGIATGTIASNAVGLVLLSGYASLVNVNASVTRGHYGVTHTVAKQATDGGATRTTGTFCQFLTGGTTPDALIFNTDLAGAALTNPMTAKGQLIQGDTGGTPSALGVGTAGQILTSGGTGAFNSWTTLGDLLPWTISINPMGGSFSNVNWDSLTPATGEEPTLASSGAQNDEVVWNVVLGAGTWSVFLVFHHFTSRGIATVYFDASSVGTIDMYGSDNAYIRGSITGISVATTAKIALKLKMATKNASSSGYGAWLDFVQLIRTA